MKVLFVDNFSINFGVMYLSSTLKEAGHSVELAHYPLTKFNDIDQYKQPDKYFDFKKITTQIIEKTPDVICFSIFSPNYQFYLHLARSIKQNSNTPIICAFR